MNETDIKISDPPAMPKVESPPKPTTTTMSWFLADITNAPVEVTPELYGRMVEHARGFLSTGSVLDWRDWRVLDEIQRRAWQEAAAELEIRSFLNRAGGQT